MPNFHQLKIERPFFDAIRRGEKTFEVRKNDRFFQTGDTLELQCIDPADPNLWPLYHTVRVTWIMPGGKYGIAADHVVMALAPVVEEPGPSEPGLEITADFNPPRIFTKSGPFVGVVSK